MKHEAEVDALRSKLQWYAETQQLVDEAVRERDMYKREVEQLRDRTGLVGGGGGSANTSLMSTGGGNAQKRNPADIRRIRELEKALDAAREGIQKRFPDSVANLLYAAIPASRGDDGASAADLQQVVRERDDLRAELAKTQSESQLLVTSLRQEYERLKLDFQRQPSRVKDGTVQPPQATADVGGGAPDMDPWDAQTGGQSVKTFAQAKDRIRYLEVENSRVRSFYAKKVESLQNKYLAQLAAIRRGTGADAKEEREKAKDVVLSATERSSLMQRVALLEDELLRTAEELGQVKAASAAGLPHMTPPSHPAVASDVPPPPVTAAAPNATDVNTERSVEFTKEERRYLTTEVTALRDRVRELSDQLEVARRATQDLSVGARAGEVTSHAPAAETTQQRELEALQETSALMTQKLRDSEQEQVRAAGQLREMQLRHEYDLSQK
ncbi:Cep162, partial [Symbiodinium microadriaticum]